MFDTFSSWLGQASEAMKDLSTQGTEMIKESGLLSYEDGSNTSKTAEANVRETDERTVSLRDVNEQPPDWSSAVEEWRLLTRAALSDKHFCAYTPAESAESGEQSTWSKVAKLLQLSDSDVQDAKDTATSGFTVAEDIAVWLPTDNTVYAAYASVVPQNLPEELYWNTIGWKLRLCMRCHRAPELLELLKILSCGPLPVAGPNPLLATPPSVSPEEFNEEHWTETEQELRRLQDKLRWRTSLEQQVRKEIELSSGNLKLLRNLVAKQEVQSPLAESVLESCAYHKLKLAKLIGEINEVQERLDGSVLDPHAPGELYASLVEANKGLLETMTTFDENRKGGAPAIVAQHGAISAEEPVDELMPSSPSTPVHVDDVEIPQAPEDCTHAASAAAAAVENEDVSFEAKLPWDDDE